MTLLTLNLDQMRMKMSLRNKWHEMWAKAHFHDFQCMHNERLAHEECGNTIHAEWMLRKETKSKNKALNHIKKAEKLGTT